MFLFLTIIQALVAASMIGVILMQRSEGGGLGMGGSPGGLMSARGAADFLTRATTVLAVLFVTLSIALAMIAAGHSSTTSTLDDSLQRDNPVTAPAPAPSAPPADQDPLAAPSDDAGTADPLGAVEPGAPAQNKPAGDQ